MAVYLVCAFGFVHSLELYADEQAIVLQKRRIVECIQRQHFVPAPVIFLQPTTFRYIWNISGELQTTSLFLRFLLPATKKVSKKNVFNVERENYWVQMNFSEDLRRE